LTCSGGQLPRRHRPWRSFATLRPRERGSLRPQRDLSLVLDRALRTRTTVVLQRGEVRALLELAEAQPGNAGIVALADAARRSL
jgi:hypothetical protein